MRIRNALLGAMPFVRPAAGVILMAAPTVPELEARLAEITAETDSFRARMEAGEDLTDEETDAIEANADEVEKLNKKIKALKLLAPQGQGRRSTPEKGQPANGNGRIVVQPNPRDDARMGMKSFGTFARAVANHYRGNGENEDVRGLRNTATTYGGEGVGTDGGFLVPPSFSTEIWQKVQAEENLLNRCTQLVTDGNSMMIPKDETTPWQTTGGVQVYWEGEAQAPSASKPRSKWGPCASAKLMALVPISEELMQDASGLESWLRAKAPAKWRRRSTRRSSPVRASVNRSASSRLFRGRRVGRAGLKSTSQPADTVWMPTSNRCMRACTPRGAAMPFG
jgi:HK97 family phage major capsid protein